MGVAAVLVTVTGILFKSVIDYKQIRGVISNSQCSVLSSLNETEFSAFSYKTEKEIFVDIMREADGRVWMRVARWMTKSNIGRVFIKKELLYENKHLRALDYAV